MFRKNILPLFDFEKIINNSLSSYIAWKTISMSQFRSNSLLSAKFGIIAKLFCMLLVPLTFDLLTATVEGYMHLIEVN